MLTPHFLFLNPTLLGLDSTFWLDSMLKLNYGLTQICWNNCEYSIWTHKRNSYVYHLYYYL